MFRMMAV